MTDTPEPNEAREVRADEAELVKALQQQIDSYYEGTNGQPRPVSAWLHALADKMDPRCTADLFVDALHPDEPRPLPAPPQEREAARADHQKEQLAELLRGRSTAEAARDPEVQALLHPSGPVAPVQGVTPEDEGGSSSSASRGPDRPASTEREAAQVETAASPDDVRRIRGRESSLAPPQERESARVTLAERLQAGARAVERDAIPGPQRDTWITTLREAARALSTHREGSARVGGWEVRCEGMHGEGPHSIERGTEDTLEVFVTGIGSYEDACKIEAALNSALDPTREGTEDV